MQSLFQTCTRATLGALVLTLAQSALANDPATDAMQAAYGPYRIALFKTNSNSQAEASQAMRQVQDAWGKVVAQFGSKPPAPYDRDAAFSTTLTQVADVYTTAAQQVAANQLAAAHDTLEKARDLLADVRRRSQVVVYSDHMNAYHAQMEHVLVGASQLLSQPSGLPPLTADVGALRYLANQLSSQAPAPYKSNPEFVDLLQAVNTSVTNLQTALWAQDAAAAKAAIAKIKAPYSKLFLKFG
jgi:hypothetical protein